MYFGCKIQLIKLVHLVFPPDDFVYPWLLLRVDHFSLLPQSPGTCPNSNVVWPQIKLSDHKYFAFYCLLFQFILLLRDFVPPSQDILSFLNFRIFIHAKNNFNHIKEGFLDYQRRNNSSVSPSQAIRCTCPFTGFNQPFCPQLNICPYLQERATKSFIL